MWGVEYKNSHSTVFAVVIFFFLFVLGLELGALHILGKYSTTELSLDQFLI